MLPSKHLLIGAVFSILIWIIFPSIGFWNAAIIFLASFLIDTDHYLYYAYMKKNISLSKAYIWFVEQKNIFLKLNHSERKKVEHAVIIFHGIEFWIILLFLIFLNKVFFFVLLGVSIHMLLEFIEIYQMKCSPYHKLSQVYVYNHNRIQRNKKHVKLI